MGGSFLALALEAYRICFWILSVLWGRGILARSCPILLRPYRSLGDLLDCGMIALGLSLGDTQ